VLLITATLSDLTGGIGKCNMMALPRPFLVIRFHRFLGSWLASKRSSEWTTRDRLTWNKNRKLSDTMDRRRLFCDLLQEAGIQSKISRDWLGRNEMHKRDRRRGERRGSMASPELLHRREGI
jgi:hypothetical protein